MPHASRKFSPAPLFRRYAAKAPLLGVLYLGGSLYSCAASQDIGSFGEATKETLSQAADKAHEKIQDIKDGN